MLRSFFAAVLALILTAIPARAADHVAIDAQFVGLDAMTAYSPTDAFLRACFKALGPRILQIPGEVGEGDPNEAGVIAAFWESMRGAKSVRLVFNDDDPAHPRVRFLMEATPIEPEKAADMARAMAFIAEKEELTLVDDGPLRKFTTDSGDEIAFGIKSGMFALRVNGLEGAGAPAGTVAGAPADAPLLLRLHVNGPNISKLLAMIPQDDPADAAKGFALLKALGLYGGESMSLDVGMWNAGRGLEGSAAFRRVRSVSFPGVDPPPTLGDAFLSLIPSDVTMVQASVFDLSVFDRALTAADLPARTDLTEESRKNLGFDIWGDFLAHLGPRYAWYQSERTGGGGIMSTVGLVELKNPDAFATSHAKLVEKINAFGAGMAKGFVRIDTVDVGGQPSFLLSAPGLPLPVAPMWTISGNVAVAGATPVAFREALAIARAKGPSIAMNPAIRERAGDRAGGLAALGYCDTPRLARSSMGAGTMVLTMLGNATRVSPASSAPALPGAPAYMEGVRPCIGVATWWGSDLVYRWTTDESLTVLGAVAVSQYAKAVTVQTVPMMVGILLPAVQKARTNAIEIKASVQVRAIGMAFTQWASSNNDVYPPSFDALVEQNLLTPEILRSPFGPVQGATTDYVALLGGTNDFAANRIIVIDAAAIAIGNHTIPVGFADGHVESLTSEELEVRLADPVNAAMKAALGLD